MRKTAFIILIFIITTSCEFGTNFKLQNRTELIIDSVVIHNGFNKTAVYRIKPREVGNAFLDFKENNPKQDGLHNVKVYFNDTMINQSFGYFSNGIPSENAYSLEIENDTIIIQ